MSDFFGGILDDLQGYASDIGEFFDSTTGQALSQAYTAGRGSSEQQKDTTSLLSIDRANGATGKGQAIESVDFGALEQRWLSRMKSFANLDTGTSVKLG